ncbi:MAG: hypothetical protein Q4D63_06585 [Neisseria animaloris]|uniref:hypothetical protein n=1 Tax=Neisseria animaloris TaxID=326522 RepID=UPI00270F26B0|nr:hypothetical protein [Neisseria animaloris]
MTTPLDLRFGRDIHRKGCKLEGFSDGLMREDAETMQLNVNFQKHFLTIWRLGFLKKQPIYIN